MLPSAGNFVLVRFADAGRPASAAQAYLQSRGIIVRGVGSYGLPDCLRITVGTADQNRAVLDALSEFAAT
ncbi:Histidinol-phosphate aminotransferase 2 [compost metagenome]